MSTADLFGVCGAALVGLGLYGLLAQPLALRKILAFNLLGSGVFLIFGVVARRGAAVDSGAGSMIDPVPQAFVITGLVVAFAATALAVALVLRLFEAAATATIDAGAQRPASFERKDAGGGVQP